MPVNVVFQIFNMIFPLWLKERAAAKARGEAVKTFNDEQMFEMTQATAEEGIALADQYEAEWNARG